jgi:tRNA threonylcarbamoyladenosine biosynthesis protein TsaE
MNATSAVATGDMRSSSVDETRDIGRRLGAAARPGTVIALVGDLGAGKTQVAKGVAEGLGVTSVVNSPTFILMNEHSGRLPMFHIDAYRVDDLDEAAAAGLVDERQARGVTVVEWADRLEGILAPERIEMRIDIDDVDPGARRLRWRASGEAQVALAVEALAAAERSTEVRAAR